MYKHCARVFLSLLFFFASFSSVHAIIILPAIVVIPIIKVVAFVISFFSIPAAGIGGLWAHTKGKSPVKVILISVFLVFILALAVGLLVKLLQPDRAFL